MPLAGGFPDILRNVAGLTGIGLLCATLLGGPLAWTGPLAYLMAGLYGLYTDWHPPTLSTPWIWPARPPHDVGGALCAAVVFAAGLAAITLRGARESPPAATAQARPCPASVRGEGAPALDRWGQGPPHPIGASGVRMQLSKTRPVGSEG